MRMRCKIRRLSCIRLLYRLLALRCIQFISFLIHLFIDHRLLLLPLSYFILHFVFHHISFNLLIFPILFIIEFLSPSLFLDLRMNHLPCCSFETLLKFLLIPLQFQIVCQVKVFYFFSMEIIFF